MEIDDICTMNLEKPLIIASNGKTTAVFYNDKCISMRSIKFSHVAWPRECTVEFVHPHDSTRNPYEEISEWEVFQKTCKRVLGYELERKFDSE